MGEFNMITGVHGEVGLIEGLRNSEEPVFAVVFEKYKSKLYSFVWRFLKDSVLCEEIVQETLIILWTNRLNLDVSYPLGPYLYTIARRLTLNALRNAATAGQAREKLWLNLNEAHNETEEAILLADLQELTEQAVAKLSSQQQLIFKLSRYEGLSHEEIAEKLQLSKHTVNNHLVEALKNLRKHFKHSGVSYSILLAWLMIK
ncbi:RNA polymerase sigma-70 factor [Pedobacter sp. KBW06]|uniref:RNA polymerase sigma factor n=1 Tax=Pedobacter sp. KBW06 TaxID=2153359 RepID=UPI000F59ECC0|nr:RNA polymerase sigma-70 factor [Pedobacter sp. KBW06]RQO74619.1 RNA polymerase sigma-70 factor [Pedobacter sp. KBW06]